MARLKDWKPVFIKALALSPNVAAAARKAGITRQAAYHTRSQDTEFSADWDDALGQAIEAAEGELYRRAVKGTGKAASDDVRVEVQTSKRLT